MEATLHYLLCCNLYSTQILELLKNVCILNPSLKNYFNEKLLNILLYGSKDFNCNMNKEILKATIKFLKIYERFNGFVFLTILKRFYHNGTYFSYIFKFFLKFRYMYRTCVKRHVTYSKFCVLFSLI